MSNVIVIGAGIAGLTVAREIHRLQPDLLVTVVTQDDGHLYPKPQLSTSMRLKKTPDQLIQLQADQLRAEGIAILAGRQVTALRPSARQIVLSDGTVMAYGDLVLATGAFPFVPPMAGDSEAVLTVNNLADYRRFREALRPGEPVLIVGGGLIGIEFTADLLSAGHTVHVVDPGTGPLPRLLPPMAGQLLAEALTRHGAVFHWGETVSGLRRTDDGWEATLSGGDTVTAGTVLSAVGLRPNVALAEAAGLPVDRGIQVNERLQVAEHVYAVGDCAVMPGGLYLPFIKPTQEQARHIARAIATGEDRPFQMQNYSIVVKVPQWPIMSTTPTPTETGVWDESATATGSRSVLRTASGDLQRVVLTGDQVMQMGEWLPLAPSLLATEPVAT
ncbi:MAG: FAD-dependent oxidoreductase [Candidatus Sericytochromatia bacterium]|nr:FAD-dependent oxidoreductase [Candidatus Sericytochromatia bacterium]